MQQKWKCQQMQWMEQESAVVLNNVNGKRLLPSDLERRCTFPRHNHLQLCIPFFSIVVKGWTLSACSPGTLPWSDCGLTTRSPLAPKLRVCWDMVIEGKGKGASGCIAGGPVGLILLALFLLSVFAVSVDHPEWPWSQGDWLMVCWDMSWNQEKNSQCLGEDDGGDKVTIYLPNFLNPIEARSYFKSQYSLCFLTHLSSQWALARVL